VKMRQVVGWTSVRQEQDHNPSDKQGKRRAEAHPTDQEKPSGRSRMSVRLPNTTAGTLNAKTRRRKEKTCSCPLIREPHWTIVPATGMIRVSLSSLRTGHSRGPGSFLARRRPGTPPPSNRTHLQGVGRLGVIGRSDRTRAAGTASAEGWQGLDPQRVTGTLDSAGHCALQLTLNNNRPSPDDGSCSFSIRAEPAAINRLGRLLTAFGELKHSELRWSDTDGELMERQTTIADQFRT
jgi:hypothetical protein